MHQTVDGNALQEWSLRHDNSQSKKGGESLGIPATFEQQTISKRKTFHDAMATGDPIAD